MKDLNAVKFEEQLFVLEACKNAGQWAKGKTLYQAWEQCERADWMMWYLAKKNINRKLLVELACDIAETVLYLVPENEKRPKIAIETTRKWLRGKATIKELKLIVTETTNDLDIHSNPSTYAIWSAINAVRAAAYINYIATNAAAHTATHAVYAVATNAHAVVDANIWSAADYMKPYKEQHKLLCAMIRQKVNIKTIK